MYLVGGMWYVLVFGWKIFVVFGVMDNMVFVWFDENGVVIIYL